MAVPLTPDELEFLTSNKLPLPGQNVDTSQPDQLDYDPESVIELPSDKGNAEVSRYGSLPEQPEPKKQQQRTPEDFQAPVEGAGMDYDPKTAIELPPDKGSFWESAGAAVGRIAPQTVKHYSDLTSQLSPEGSSVESVAEKVGSGAKAVENRYMPETQFEKEHPLTTQALSGVTQLGTSATQSLPPYLAGFAAVTPWAGPVAGHTAGSITSALSYATVEYKNAKEQMFEAAKKAGVTPDEFAIRVAAMKGAAAEGLGEFAGTIIGYKILGKLFAPFSKTAKPLAERSIKDITGMFGKVTRGELLTGLGTENLTEFGQGTLETKFYRDALKKAGLTDEQINNYYPGVLESGVQTIVPTLVSSLLGAGGAAAGGKFRGDRAIKALEDPTVKPERRAKALGQVTDRVYEEYKEDMEKAYKQAKKDGKSEAEASKIAFEKIPPDFRTWLKNASDNLANKMPIDTNVEVGKAMSPADVIRDHFKNTPALDPEEAAKVKSAAERYKAQILSKDTITQEEDAQIRVIDDLINEPHLFRALEFPFAKPVAPIDLLQQEEKAAVDMPIPTPAASVDAQNVPQTPPVTPPGVPVPPPASTSIRMEPNNLLEIDEERPLPPQMTEEDVTGMEQDLRNRGQIDESGNLIERKQPVDWSTATKENPISALWGKENIPVKVVGTGGVVPIRGRMLQIQHSGGIVTVPASEIRTEPNLELQKEIKEPNPQAPPAAPAVQWSEESYPQARSQKHLDSKLAAFNEVVDTYRRKGDTKFENEFKVSRQRLTPRQLFAEEVARINGAKEVVFVETDPDTGGFHFRGNVFLNVNSKKDMISTALHESLVHIMQREAGTFDPRTGQGNKVVAQIYGKHHATIMGAMREAGILESELQSIADTYNVDGKTLSERGKQEELIARVVSKATSKAEFWQYIKSNDVKLYDKLVAAARRFLALAKDKFKDIEGMRALRHFGTHSIYDPNNLARFYEAVGKMQVEWAAHVERERSAGRNPITFAGDEIDSMVKAYHGGPHKIEGKRDYTLSKVGSGEGAAAYGWGAYFASLKDVAKTYAMLGSRNTKHAYFNGKELTPAFLESVKDETKLMAYQYLAETTKTSDAIGLLKRRLFTYQNRRPDYDETQDQLDRQAEKTRGAMRFIEDNMKSIEYRDPGYVYHAELDVNDEDLLDWDKPLSEQSEKVKKALEEVPVEIKAIDMSGKNIYDALSSYFGEMKTFGPKDNPSLQWYDRIRNDKAASQYLASIGIPGIRFKAGQITGYKGKESHNYVIFDDKLITLTHRNDEEMADRAGGTPDFALSDIRKIAKDTQDQTLWTFAENLGKNNQVILPGTKTKEDARQMATLYVANVLHMPEKFVASGRQIDPAQVEKYYLKMIEGKNFEDPVASLVFSDLEWAIYKSKDSGRLSSMAEKEASMVQDQREKALKEIAIYLHQNLLNNDMYRPEEAALILAMASKWNVGWNDRETWAPRELTPNNLHPVMTIDGATASMIRDGIRAGKTAKQAFVDAVVERHNQAENSVDSTKNGWVVFKKSDSMDDAYALKDAIVTAPSWCVSGSVDMAHGYLSRGDFHVFYKDGKAEVGIGTDNGRISEPPRGNTQNQSLTKDQEEIAVKYLKKGDISGGESFLEESQLKKDIVSSVEHGRVEGLLKKYITVYINEDGIRYEKDFNNISFQETGGYGEKKIGYELRKKLESLEIDDPITHNPDGTIDINATVWIGSSNVSNIRKVSGVIFINEHGDTHELVLKFDNLEEVGGINLTTVNRSGHPKLIKFSKLKKFEGTLRASGKELDFGSLESVTKLIINGDKVYAPSLKEIGEELDLWNFYEAKFPSLEFAHQISLDREFMNEDNGYPPKTADRDLRKPAEFPSLTFVNVISLNEATGSFDKLETTRERIKLLNIDRDIKFDSLSNAGNIKHENLKGKFYPRISFPSLKTVDRRIHIETAKNVDLPVLESAESLELSDIVRDDILEIKTWGWMGKIFSSREEAVEKWNEWATQENDRLMMLTDGQNGYFARKGIMPKVYNSKSEPDMNEFDKRFLIPTSRIGRDNDPDRFHAEKISLPRLRNVRTLSLGSHKDVDVPVLHRVAYFNAVAADKLNAPSLQHAGMMWMPYLSEINAPEISSIKAGSELGTSRPNLFEALSIEEYQREHKKKYNIPKEVFDSLLNGYVTPAPGEKRNIIYKNDMERDRILGGNAWSSMEDLETLIDFSRKESGDLSNMENDPDYIKKLREARKGREIAKVEWSTGTNHSKTVSVYDKNGYEIRMINFYRDGRVINGAMGLKNPRTSAAAMDIEEIFGKDLAGKILDDNEGLLLGEEVKANGALVSEAGVSGSYSGAFDRATPEDFNFMRRESPVTPKQDDDYLKAANSGDLKTAQRMVDEAAKKAGYDIEAWHGIPTDERKYNKFLLRHRPKKYIWQTVSPEVEIGKYRAESTGAPVAVYKDKDGTYSAASDEISKEKKGFPTLDAAKKWLEDNRADVVISDRPAFYFAENKLYAQQFQRISGMGQEREHFGGGRTDRYFLSGKHIFDIDNKGDSNWLKNWLRANREYATSRWDGNTSLIDIFKAAKDSWWAPFEVMPKIIDDLKSAGYDGYKNIEGGSLRFEGQTEEDIANTARKYKGRGGSDASIVYAVFSSSQIKSADPITRDDAGNIIPLSERFNDQKDEINYELKDNDKNELLGKPHDENRDPTRQPMEVYNRALENLKKIQKEQEKHHKSIKTLAILLRDGTEVHFVGRQANWMHSELASGEWGKIGNKELDAVLQNGGVRFNNGFKIVEMMSPTTDANMTVIRNWLTEQPRAQIGITKPNPGSIPTSLTRAYAKGFNVEDVMRDIREFYNPPAKPRYVSMTTIYHKLPDSVDFDIQDASNKNIISPPNSLPAKTLEFLRLYMSDVPARDMGKLEQYYTLPFWFAKNHPEFKKVLQTQIRRQENKNALFEFLTENPDSPKGIHPFLALKKNQRNALFDIIVESDEENRYIKDDELTKRGMDKEQIAAYHAWHKTFDKAFKTWLAMAEASIYAPYNNKEKYPWFRYEMSKNPLFKNNEIMRREVAPMSNLQMVAEGYITENDMRTYIFGQSSLSDEQKEAQWKSFQQALKDVQTPREKIAKYRAELDKVKFYMPRFRKQGELVTRVWEGKAGESRIIEDARADYLSKNKSLAAKRNEQRLKTKYPGKEVTTTKQITTPESIFEDLNPLAMQRFIENAIAKMSMRDEEANVDVLNSFRDAIFEEIANELNSRGFGQRALHRGGEQWVVKVKDANGKTIDTIDVRMNNIPGKMDENGNEVPLTDNEYQKAYDEALQLGINNAKIDASLKYGDNVTLIPHVAVIKGYEDKDGQQVFKQYMSGISGFLSKKKAAFDFYEALRSVGQSRVRKDRGGGRVQEIKVFTEPRVFEYARQYVTDMLRNQGKLDEISGRLRLGAYLYNISGKLSAAAVNLTQNFVSAIPVLRRYVKLARQDGYNGPGAHALYLTAMKDVLPGGKMTDIEKKFLREEHEKGNDTAQYLQEVMGASDSNIKNWTSAFTRFISKPFSMAEEFNRRTAMLAMFRLQNALPQAKRVSNQERAQRAVEYSNEVHYLMGKANLPEWARSGTGIGTLARTAYTFRGFNHNFVLMLKEFSRMRDENGRQVGRMQLDVTGMSLAYIAIFGGAGAIPFVDDFLDLLERIMKTPYRLILRMKAKEVGPWMDDLATGGLPAAAFGVDLSGSMSMGIPLVGETPAESVYGVYGGMAKRGMQAVESGMVGDYDRAAEMIMPMFIGNAMRSLREYREGVTSPTGKILFDEETNMPMQSTGLEATKRFAGFRNIRESEASRDVWSYNNAKMAMQNRRLQIMKEIKLAGPDKAGEVAEKLIPEFNRGIFKMNGAVKPIKASAVRRLFKQRPDKGMMQFMAGESDYEGEEE